MLDDDDDIRFEWNPDKAASNAVKHGFTFQDASHVFDDPMRLEEADRFSRGEYRALCIGKVDGMLLTVVFSEPDEGVIRMISARAATAHERKSYESRILHP